MYYIMSDPDNQNWEIAEKLLPTYREKTVGWMKAVRTVKRITFVSSEANPSEELQCPS